ncbi:hypothetical protein CDD81_374 [Ophiocordyceps australis]|uniref:Uncharacterized protein n=1 Tax=Ophiocordyceps australis TaxID=1399860 RepID=A0A2C5Y1B6_9HYPO|nr:hypothetical protein CDD81_374 [Ophiocordyceps australis]
MAVVNQSSESNKQQNNNNESSELASSNMNEPSEGVFKQLEDFKNTITKQINDFNNTIMEKLDSINERLDKAQIRLDATERHFYGMERRICDMEHRLDNTERLLEQNMPANQNMCPQGCIKCQRLAMNKAFAFPPLKPSSSNPKVIDERQPSISGFANLNLASGRPFPPFPKNRDRDSNPGDTSKQTSPLLLQTEKPGFKNGPSHPPPVRTLQYPAKPDFPPHMWEFDANNCSDGSALIWPVKK